MFVSQSRPDKRLLCSQPGCVFVLRPCGITGLLLGRAPCVHGLQIGLAAGHARVLRVRVMPCLSPCRPLRSPAAALAPPRLPRQPVEASFLLSLQAPPLGCCEMQTSQSSRLPLQQTTSRCCSRAPSGEAGWLVQGCTGHAQVCGDTASTDKAPSAPGASLAAAAGRGSGHTPRAPFARLLAPCARPLSARPTAAWAWRAASSRSGRL